MVCVSQIPGQEAIVSVKKYDKRPRGVLKTNEDGSVEAMVEVIEVNKQLAARIKQKQADFKDRLKSVTALRFDTGSGQYQHGSIELQDGGIRALTMSVGSLGGQYLSYDDLLTLNLQSKASVFGTSKATSFLRLAFNEHANKPEMNAAELFASIQEKYGIMTPKVDAPNHSASMRR
jgi:hypothetical protein